MAVGFEFKLTGADKLSAAIKMVSDDVKKKSGRFALRKAANLVATALQVGAQRLDDPKTAESISRNVAVRFSNRRFKKTGDLMFRVGILGGATSTVGSGKKKANPGGVTFYWRFLEFGTEKMAARPFARSALSRNIDLATAEFIRHFQASLDRVARKASGGV